MKTQQVKQQTDTPFQTKAKNQSSISGILQRYAKVFQLLDTDEKSITTKNHGTGYYKYEYDPKGNIKDFSKNKATSTPKGDNPVVPNSKVNLESSPGSGEGTMRSGNNVDIIGASRSQHFSIADGDMDMVPTDRKGKYTWHHLTPKYQMELVDMAVHQKFGHTGGYSLWT